MTDGIANPTLFRFVSVFLLSTICFVALYQGWFLHEIFAAARLLTFYDTKLALLPIVFFRLVRANNVAVMVSTAPSSMGAPGK